MTTVYLVASGQYSDYHIEAAFSTKENAEFYLKDRDLNSYDEPRIEEYELDRGLDLAKQGLKLYRIVMKKDGSILNLYDWGWPDSPETDSYVNRGTWEGSWIFNILAKSEEHAIKIANERRSQLLAFDKWEE